MPEPDMLPELEPLPEVEPDVEPPRSLLCELQPANANNPANSEITKILLFMITSLVHFRR
jgi:hypothetical protein